MISDRFVAIIEDDELLREVLAGLVSDTGIRCISFPSADDALIYLIRNWRECALVIADHEVPGQLSGSDLAAMVESEWRGLPVVIMSGYDAETLGLPSGTKFLRKPWAVHELLELVTASMVHDSLQKGIGCRR